MSNHTCPSEVKPVDPVPFYTNGSLNFKAHDVGWIICGFFTLIASAASFWLIWKHLTYYTCPPQQRHIVRMLFMVPIYAIVSLLSYVFYHEAVYYQTIRDCYEAVVITSFFYLLLQYVGDTPAEQHEVFRAVKLDKWFWPLGRWKYRPSGLHFLWLMKICILQYAIVRPVCTLVAVGLQYFNLYCLESWAPYFGHIYITLAISVSVTVAMYCVIQFYMPIQAELKPYSPVLKFLAVKSVVFLTFWQDSFLSLLVYFGAIKQSEYMSAADIQVGINALLETFEMCIFAFLHIKAFTYIIYRPNNHARTTRRWRAFLDVLDYRDWWYQMRQTSRYVVSRHTYTIADDIRREKYSHLEKALGRERWSELQRERETTKQEMPSFWREGCEPTPEDEVEERLMKEEKAAEGFYSNVDEEKQEDDRGARRNRAFDPTYDPERESLSDRALDDSHEGNEVRGKDEEIHTLLPTLPQLDFDPAQDETGLLRVRDGHTTVEEGYAYAGFDEDEAFVPRKGTRAAKEGSNGHSGAFWRTYRRTTTSSRDAALVEEIGAANATTTSSQVSNAAQAKRAEQNVQRMLKGPKGRSIALVLPTPLSSDKPLPAALPSEVTQASSQSSLVRPASTSAISYAVPRQTSVALSSTSSQSRIRFSEIKPSRSRDIRDDPEAELPSFNGYVVAGGQSLRQLRERQNSLQNERTRREKVNVDARTRHDHSHQPEKFTAPAFRGSILQRNEVSRIRQSNPMPHYQNTASYVQDHPQQRNSGPSSSSYEPRETREGFQFEYIDD